MQTRAVADAIHDSTKHGTPPVEPERLVQYRRLDPDNAPEPFKRYRNRPISPLPRALVPSTHPAVAVLSGAQGDGKPLDVSLLATLLYLTAGVTRTTEASARRKIYFRAAMSAGNLHPVEVYVVAGPGMAGVPAGVHHFAPLEFGLTELRSGDFRGSLSLSAPIALIFTGVVWRTTWKYGERGWRHLYWDTGAMLANLLSAAEAHGVDAHVFAGFADQTVNDLLGIDGVDEVPIAVVALGSQAGTKAGPILNLAPLHLEVVQVAPNPIRLPLVVDAQAGSALTIDDIDDWLLAARAVSSNVPTSIDLPPSAPEEPIEAVILRRGSTRAMRHDSIGQHQLMWPLAAATRAVTLDATPGGTLLEHYVNAHAIDGLQPGAYRWSSSSVELIASDESARKVSAGLCLNQPLGGDSAYTVFHNARLDPIMDALGSRGYRVAQLEAGIVSGRLALAAFALGLGATGLTFFDDLVSHYFDTAALPMLATAVGVSDTVPAPAGGPGAPANLGGYQRLMNRVAFQFRRSESR